MKIITLTLALLFIATQFSHAQSKSELEAQLTKANATIDSINLRLSSLEVMYAYAKENIVKEDFDPTKFSSISDSINSLPDSLVLAMTAENKVLTDSLTSLSNENDKLNEVIHNCVLWINAVSKEPVTRKDVEKGMDERHKKIVEQLGQLKALLDDGVLTQEEFDAKKTLLMEKW